MAAGVRVGITLACTECKRPTTRRTSPSGTSRNGSTSTNTAAGAAATRRTGRRASVARQTRQQRRARREQGDGKPATKPAAAEQPKVSQRARARQQQVRPGASPPKQQTGRRDAQPRGRFVRESWAELKKVEWPGRSQVTQATIVVIVACAIVGAFLYVCDLVFRHLVEQIL